jgi:nucleoside-diphosphate-sugar epimerase
MKKEAANQIYFGTDFHPYTMREFVDTVSAYYGVRTPTLPSFLVTLIAYVLGVFKLVGVKVPIYPFRLKNIKANYCYDIQKSIKLGYNPDYDLKKGVYTTLDWYKTNNLI